ncbi:MAG: DNA internalization-related competence protein ComEC/Rec2 [Woeseiaceae bacterium]
MIWACVLILAGGFAAQHSRLPLSSDTCLLILVSSILVLGVRRARGAGWFTFGLGWFLLAGQGIVDDRLQPRYAGDSLLANVRIVDFPKKFGQSVVMVVEPVADPRLPPRSRISWFEPGVTPEIGDVWRLELRLKRPRGLSNPGVFDREAWLFRSRIHATGYVVGGKRNQRLDSSTESAVNAFRRGFVERTGRVASSPEIAAVLAAIAVGARHDVSREQWRRYAISGTSHLMAISGLHIGLAAGVAFLFARFTMSFLPLFAHSHLVSIVAAVIFSGAYALVSGLGVPAQRATLMLAIAAVALLRRRSVSPVETIALAAMVVFVIDPVATMAPGFHLSFSAVVLLMWLACRRNRDARTHHLVTRAADRVRQLFAIQTMLLFGLMPLTILLFQRIALLALPVNLLAVPLFSLATVPFTLIGLATGSTLEAAGNAALTIAAQSIECLEAVIAFVVSIPLADVTVGGYHSFDWLVVILPALFSALPRGWPGRYVAFLAVALLLLQTPTRPPAGCVDVSVLDVGQGLSIVLETRNHTLLYDTGVSYRGGGSVAEQVVVPFLESRRVDRIDWLIVSHADVDHSGGVATLLDHTDVGQLLVGEPLREAGHAALRCEVGTSWKADDVRFSILHPRAESPRVGNDSSCVLLVRAGRYGLLLTGDIEVAAERQIIEERTWTRIDAVIVPHHGSLTSSSATFVDAVAPRVAIVSAGFENRWGLPKEAVSKRWQAVGAEVLNTAKSGAVRFRFCRDSGLGTVTRDRDDRRRFWRDGAH